MHPTGPRMFRGSHGTAFITHEPSKRSVAPMPARRSRLGGIAQHCIHKLQTRSPIRGSPAYFRSTLSTYQLINLSTYQLQPINISPQSQLSILTFTP